MVATWAATHQHLTVSVWLFRSGKLTPSSLFAVGQALFLLDWSQLQERSSPGHFHVLDQVFARGWSAAGRTHCLWLPFHQTLSCTEGDLYKLRRLVLRSDSRGQKYHIYWGLAWRNLQLMTPQLLSNKWGPCLQGGPAPPLTAQEQALRHHIHETSFTKIPANNNKVLAAAAHPEDMGHKLEGTNVTGGQVAISAQGCWKNGVAFQQPPLPSRSSTRGARVVAIWDNVERGAPCRDERMVPRLCGGPP